MNKKQARQVTRYLLITLDYLDGKGIVFEDKKLVKAAATITPDAWGKEK